MSLPLVTTGGPSFVDNHVSVVAADLLGRVRIVSFTLRAPVSRPPENSSLTVQLPQGTSDTAASAVAASVGGRVSGHSVGSATWTIDLPPGSNPTDAAATLRADPAVGFATVNEPLTSDDPPLGYPDDPAYTSLQHEGAWHLFQPDDQDQIARYAKARKLKSGPDCSVNGNGCLSPTATCLLVDVPGSLYAGECACNSDADCPGKTHCITDPNAHTMVDGENTCFVHPDHAGLCASCGRHDADIDWHAILATVFAIQQAGAEVLAAIIETKGTFAWKHDDLRHRVWTNALECCGSTTGPCPDADGNGLPECMKGEGLLDWVEFGSAACTEEGATTPPNCHCAVVDPAGVERGTASLIVPFHRRCVRVAGAATLGTICTKDEDCGIKGGQCDVWASQAGTGKCIKGAVGQPCTSDTDCDTAPVACAPMGPFTSCTLGLPGRAFVDDDGDGFTDLEDPDVQRLLFEPVRGIMLNGLDDDFSCQNDSYNPTGKTDPNPYDPVLHPDGCIDDPSELLLAALDDDEDGYIDDIHGADIVLARGTTFPFGHLWASTHDENPGRHGERHATLTAGFLGAEVNNGQWIAGVTSVARLVTLTASSGSLDLATQYAARVGARVVNTSFGAYVQQSPGEADAQYLAELMDRNKRFHGSADPNTLYVISAGNFARDLGAAPNPFTGEFPPQEAIALNPQTGVKPAIGPWRYPQNVLPRRGIVVGASDYQDEFAARWPTCAGFDWGNNTTWVNCFPLDAMDEPDFDVEPGSNYGSLAVDLAAPGTDLTGLTWIGALGSAAHSGKTGTSFSAPIAAGAAALLMSADPGRYGNHPRRVVDRLKQTVETNAADGTATYEGRTDELGRIDLANAFDTAQYPLPPVPSYSNLSWQIGESAVTDTKGAVLFHQSSAPLSLGGQTDVLFRVYGAIVGSTVVERRPSLHVANPDGTFQNWTGTVAPLQGFFSEVAHGDLNGDGCDDLVLAGFLELDPAAPPGALTPFKGRPDAVLFQNVDPNGLACAATFSPAPEALVAAMTSKEEMDRKVTLADVDLDGDLDILLPGVHAGNQPGADHDTRLYLNDSGNGLVDASALLPQDSQLDGWAIAACDLTGDGLPDLIESGGSATGVVPAERIPRILVASMPGGPGTLGYTAVAPGATGLPALAHAQDIACADIDLDGNADLVLAVRDAKNIYALGHGDGTFADVSNRLPDLQTSPPGFEYFTDVDHTQAVAVCDLEDDFPNPTLFYGNGSAGSNLWQSNAVMRFNAAGLAYSVHQALGFEFDTVLDRTGTVLCADLDGNGFADAVFVGNVGGRDHLYRYTGGTP